LDSIRAKEGGLDAQFFSIWVEPELYGGGGAGAIARADAQIAAVRVLAEKHPEMWELGNLRGGYQAHRRRRKNGGATGPRRWLCD